MTHPSRMREGTIAKVLYLHYAAVDNPDALASAWIKHEFPLNSHVSVIANYREVLRTPVYARGWLNLDLGVLGQFYDSGSFYRLVLKYEDGRPAFTQQSQRLVKGLQRYGRDVTMTAAATPDGAAQQAREAEWVAFCLDARVSLEYAITRQRERTQASQERERVDLAKWFNLD